MPLNARTSGVLVVAPEMAPVSSRTGSSMAAPAVLMANKVVAISAARFMFFLFVQASISELPAPISLRFRLAAGAFGFWRLAVGSVLASGSGFFVRRRADVV